MNFDDIPRCYITLACNFRCPYCVLSKRHSKTISASRWIKLLNNWPGDAVILAGGEPTIKADFIELVNGLDKPDIRIYSNLSFPLDMLDELPKKLFWFCSFHPDQGANVVDTITRIKALRKRGDTVKVHTIEPGRDDYVSQFADRGIRLWVDVDLWDAVRKAPIPKFPGSKNVTCDIRRTYIGPDGLRYICVRKLEDGDESGVIRDQLPMAVKSCGRYGDCSPCDVSILSVT